MRTTWIALIALACMMPVAADAARRDERAQTTRTAVAKPNPAAKVERAPARAAAAPSRAAATRQATVSGRNAGRQAVAARPAPARVTAGRAVATPSRVAVRPGDRRNLRQAFAVTRARPGEARARSGFFMRVASAATLPRESNRRTGYEREGVRGWQAGLPRADYSQQSCPAGTFATLARGHDDVVRCMPI